MQVAETLNHEHLRIRNGALQISFEGLQRVAMLFQVEGRLARPLKKPASKMAGLRMWLSQVGMESTQYGW